MALPKVFAPLVFVSLLIGCVAPAPLTAEEKRERRQELIDWVECVEAREIHDLKQDAAGTPKTPAPQCD